jgi:GH3 auxin-responsive promoter
VNIGATLANSAWLGSSVRPSRALHRALGDPALAQQQWLRKQLTQHASCEFGETHTFRAIADYAAFARHVPLAMYSDVEPWITRIRNGETSLLSAERVTHLAPTSASSGARKLIPFTASLQRGFSSAVSAWMVDLVRQRPMIRGGPAYWSVSPLADDASGGVADAVPVGFADDADYLGAGAAWLVRHALAVPAAVRHVRDVSAFWDLTLLALLRARDLRLISIWHPSFLELMLTAADASWPVLLAAVESGECPHASALPDNARAHWRASPNAARAAELRAIGPHEWWRWWPQLQVVSCWGEQAAEAGWLHLQRRVPHVLVQPKGLLATEAVVTLPIGTRYPLAVTSHFFEFIGANGECRLADALVTGETYEVVVTNGGGLWRYRLGDMVECTGRLLRTPTLRFVGRAGNVSDLRGEKLSESFVATVLREVWLGGSAPPFAELHASEHTGGAGYVLYFSADEMTDVTRAIEARLDSLLSQNPHYALARRLGQLQPARAVTVTDAAARQQVRARGVRLGDAKPRSLVSVHGSTEHLFRMEMPQ